MLTNVDKDLITRYCIERYTHVGELTPDQIVVHGDTMHFIQTATDFQDLLNYFGHPKPGLPEFVRRWMKHHLMFIFFAREHDPANRPIMPGPGV